jgi:hypothetical protein
LSAVELPDVPAPSPVVPAVLGAPAPPAPAAPQVTGAAAPQVIGAAAPQVNAPEAAAPLETGAQAPQEIPVPPLPPAPEDRRASGVAATAERSFTALLLLLAVVVVFLAVHGRLDRRDPKLDRAPSDAGGDVRRFR